MSFLSIILFPNIGSVRSESDTLASIRGRSQFATVRCVDFHSVSSFPFKALPFRFSHSLRPDPIRPTQAHMSLSGSVTRGSLIRTDARRSPAAPFSRLATLYRRRASDFDTLRPSHVQ